MILLCRSHEALEIEILDRERTMELELARARLSLQSAETMRDKKQPRPSNLHAKIDSKFKIVVRAAAKNKESIT